MAQDSVQQPPVVPPAPAQPGAPLTPAAPTSADSDQVSVAGDSIEQVQNSVEFRRLRRRFRTFVFPMTVAFLAWYLLYVIASGFARDFMGQKVIGNINVALIFGVLQFVSTFGIAILYTWYANRRLDPVSKKLRGEMHV
ncbi:MAG: DUF485 domain-containing protein [Candidatus Dormibacteraeota bacterium]|nr:DUF485 domain-containing protein [Candidatus Dormibacteraeota bacterium]